MTSSRWELPLVPAEAMALWCEALGDDNAIHVDPAAAEALGFGPRTVNPGPTNLAYLLNMVMEAQPDAWVRCVEAALLGNVLAGDGVTAQGTWDEYGMICDAELALETGHVVLKARIEIENGRDVDGDGEGIRSQRL
ncbi:MULTISPECIES: MaoC/PaaZ C-terminal domain-containing protein [unclassified Novosphingobium]|uniref:MaoC/PaaZ C-terminal domain-containing protein n=1 Tax=unclassified Novosphingobium TaxID=2644732 RepID=UPI00135A36ED|nr:MULTISPECIES: MaoC/PaaZ C-terminal domain-containing protein [unclassified Novosphingobium]